MNFRNADKCRGGLKCSYRAFIHRTAFFDVRTREKLNILHIYFDLLLTKMRCMYYNSNVLRKKKLDKMDLHQSRICNYKDHPSGSRPYGQPGPLPIAALPLY